MVTLGDMRKAGSAVLVLMMACSSGGIALDQVVPAHKHAVCRYLARCGYFPDVATCVRANLRTFPPAMEEMLRFPPARGIGAAVEHGKILYDGSKLEQCLDAIASFTCDPQDWSGRNLPIECVDAVRGTLPGGAPCILSEECISQYCMPEAAEDGSTAHCDSHACCQGTCVGDAPPGPLLVGDPCPLLAGCPDGSYCDIYCIAVLPEGALCSQDFQCGPGLACLGSGHYGRCMPAAAASGPGGLPGATCGFDGTDPCSPYYHCNYDSHRCESDPLIGEACNPLIGCFEQNAYCDRESWLCTERHGPGEHCPSGLDSCVEDYYCADHDGTNTCMLLPGVGCF